VTPPDASPREREVHNMPAPADYRITLSPEQERKRIVTIPQAAEILAISEDTFRRRYGHLIRSLSPRRRGVSIGDVFDIATNGKAA
jgi:hypothetical protein